MTTADVDGFIRVLTRCIADLQGKLGRAPNFTAASSDRLSVQPSSLDGELDKQDSSAATAMLGAECYNASHALVTAPSQVTRDGASSADTDGAAARQ